MTLEPDRGAIEIIEGEGMQTWLLDHPPVNALSPELLDALEAAIQGVRDREEIGTVVIGSSLRVFSAGADAAWMAEVVTRSSAAGLLDEFNRLMDRFREICTALRTLPALTIAAIDGHALAGGLELAAACDLRFAADSEKLRIGVPEMDLFGAMPSGGGGVQFLSRLLGSARAIEFILDAKPVSPQRAESIGIVQRLCPPGEVLSAAETFATEVARKAGRVGISALKRAVYGGEDRAFEAAMAFDAEVHWNAMREGNFIRGVESFMREYGSRS